jgi:hypothetical protein
MSFRARFVLISLFNGLLMIATFYFLINSGVDLSQRLIDLQLDNKKELGVFLWFIGGMLAAFLVNFGILSSRKSEVSYESIREIALAMRH